MRFNERVMIRPTAPGSAVHPGSCRMVADDGETVVWSPYWIRRVAEGAITVVEPAPDPTTKKPAKGKEAA